MAGQLHHDRAAHVAKRLRPVAVEAAHAWSVAGEHVERREEPLFSRVVRPVPRVGTPHAPPLGGGVLGRGRRVRQRRRRASRGDERGRRGEARGRLAALPGGDAVAHGDEAPVELEVDVGGHEPGVELVVDHVVAKPEPDVAVELGRVAPQALPEALDVMKALLAGGGANAHEQLVEMDEGKRERRLLYHARAHGRPPREVAAQLAVAHGLVGWEVLLEVAAVGDIVRVVLHEAGLMVEDALAGRVAKLWRGCEGAHLLAALGEVARHLRAAPDDGLVGKGAAGKRAVCPRAGAREDTVDDLLDCLRAPGVRSSRSWIHVAPPGPLLTVMGLYHRANRCLSS